MLTSPVESPSNRMLVRSCMWPQIADHKLVHERIRTTLTSLNTVAWCSATWPLLNEWISGSEKLCNLSCIYVQNHLMIFLLWDWTHIFKNHVIRNNLYVFMQCSFLFKYFYYHIYINNTMVTKINKMATTRSLLERPAEKTRNGILWLSNTSSCQCRPSLHHTISHDTPYSYATNLKTIGTFCTIFGIMCSLISYLINRSWALVHLKIKDTIIRYRVIWHRVHNGVLNKRTPSYYSK